MPAPSLKRLDDLLVDLFDVNELRLFLTHTFGEKFMTGLPEGTITRRHFAAKAADALGRHGLADTARLRWRASIAQ